MRIVTATRMTRSRLWVRTGLTLLECVEQLVHTVTLISIHNQHVSGEMDGVHQAVITRGRVQARLVVAGTNEQPSAMEYPRTDPSD